MPTSIGVTRLASGTVTGYLVGRKADMQITNATYTYDDDGNVTGITETSEQPRDGDPDTFEMGGAVTFSPTVRHLTWTHEGGKPQMIHLVDVVCSFDARGTLVGPDGEENVVLTATDAPGITPTGWGWKVSFGDSRDARGTLVAGADPDRDSFVFSLPAGSTVDLAVAEAAAGAAANPKYVVVDSTTAQRAEAAAERAEESAASVDLTGYLKSADAEATYAPKSHKHAMADVTGLQAALDAKASTGTATTSTAGIVKASSTVAVAADGTMSVTCDGIGAATASEVSALVTRMDDAESSIAHLAERLPIYYYTDVPSESSITEKPQLAVIKGGAVYLVE